MKQAMHRYPRIRLSIAAAAPLIAVLGTARAAEPITIPAYTPDIGVERHYRVQKTTQTDVAPWLAQQALPAVMRADLRLSATVLSRHAAGLGMRWRLSADLPADAAGAADSYAMNAMLRDTLTVYGVEQLDIETDAAGTPTTLRDADRIVAGVERNVAATGPGGVARYALQTVKENPLTIVNILAPEVMTLALAQAAQPATATLGQEWTVAGSDTTRGVMIPSATTWRLESIDAAARTARFSARQRYDAGALLQSQRQTLDRMAAILDEKTEPVTDAQRAEIGIVTQSREMTFVISTRDGATVEALDQRTMQIGAMKQTTAAHIWREDHAPTLPAPPAWHGVSVTGAEIQSAASPASEPPRDARTPKEPAPRAKTRDTQRRPAAANDSQPADRAGNAATLALKVAKARTVMPPATSGPAVEVTLTPDGARAFAKFTRGAIGKTVQLLVDGKVVSAPVVREPIEGGSVTIAGLDLAEAREIARRLSGPGADIRVRLAP